MLGFLSAFRRQHARIGRHIGVIEAAFAEYRAKLVGKPEGDDESVGDRAGAQYGAEREIAAEAGQAREQREPADGKKTAKHQFEPDREAPPRRRAPILAPNPFAMVDPGLAMSLTRLPDETLQHHFAAGFVKIDSQLDAVDGNDAARPEFDVKDTGAFGEFRFDV